MNNGGRRMGYPQTVSELISTRRPTQTTSLRWLLMSARWLCSACAEHLANVSPIFNSSMQSSRLPQKNISVQFSDTESEEDEEEEEVGAAEGVLCRRTLLMPFISLLSMGDKILRGRGREGEKSLRVVQE